MTTLNPTLNPTLTATPTDTSNYKPEETFITEFKGEEFKKFLDIAEKDFHQWEAKRTGQKQCFNTINACVVGVFAEATVSKYAKQKYKGYENFSVRNWGMSERTQNKQFYSKPDIEVQLKDYTFKIEVKGSSSHNTGLQILPYHINKYIKNDVNVVVFVEVDYDRYNSVASCKIICKESPKIIAKEWEMKRNAFGKSCYTHPEYL